MRLTDQQLSLFDWKANLRFVIHTTQLSNGQRLTFDPNAHEDVKLEAVIEVVTTQMNVLRKQIDDRHDELIKTQAIGDIDPETMDLQALEAVTTRLATILQRRQNG